jgi:hypothetical protein
LKGNARRENHTGTKYRFSSWSTDKLIKDSSCQWSRTKGYSFNIPVACSLPRVMREKNIHDAMGILKQTARGLGYYHLADINGHMSGIESIHNDFELLYPERDMLLHSNQSL